MKHYLFFYLLISLALSTRSQNINKATHRHMDGSSNVVGINSKSYYVEHAYRDSTNLVGIGYNGQTIFKTSLKFFTPGSKGGNRIIKTLDKKLAILLHLHTECDVVTDSAFLVKCDTSGLVIYKKFISSGMSANNVTDFTQHTDSSFYLSCDSGPVVFHYSKLGLAIGSMTTAFSQIHAITALQNGNLLINGLENGVYKNCELSTANSAINQQATTYTASCFKQGNPGQLMG